MALTLTNVLTDFKIAAEQIAEDLDIAEKIDIDPSESQLGFDITARASKDSKGFDFWVSSDSGGSDYTMKASLSIDFRDGAAPFYFQENIDYIVGHSSYLSRWASYAVFKFKQVHEKTLLNSVFHETEIRVYGLPGYCDPAIGEARLLFHGMLHLQKGKILVYKFRHVDSPSGYLMRSFSYAIWVTTSKGPCFWGVFPDFCGLDSGQGFRTYREFQALLVMLEKKFQVEVRKFDIPYEELETFLLGNAEGFSSIDRTDDLYKLSYYGGPSKVLEGSENEFKKFKEQLQNKQYPQALRDLRALVQQAEENLAKKLEIDYSSIQEPDVNKLAGLLIEKKALDGRLRSWFNAFTAVANIASHRSYPTAEDLKNEVCRIRIMLTFQLGLQLLEELDEPLTEKLKFVKFSAKIKKQEIN